MTTPPTGPSDPYAPPPWQPPPPQGQPQYPQGQPQYPPPQYGPYGQPQYGPQQYGQQPYAAYPAAPAYSAYGQPQGAGSPAGMGNRLLARIIDGLIVGVPAVIIFAILAANVAKNTTCTTDVNGFEHCSTGGGVSGLLIGYLIIIVAAVLYEVYFIGVRGATIGKRVMSVKVIDSATGRPIGMGRAFVRYLVLGVTGAICTLGYWSPFFDDTKRNQGWHDKAANDFVVVGK